MSHPCEEVRPQSRQKSMRRNQVQRLVQPHPRLRQQIRRRLHDRQATPGASPSPESPPAPPGTPRNSSDAVPAARPARPAAHRSTARIDVVSCASHTSFSYLNQPRKFSPALRSGLLQPARSCPCYFNFYLVSSARFARSFRVARNNVFFAVSSVVFNISPIVRSFNPW